ncbi:Apoptosis-inducing factor 3 [Perkinsus olseni]|uniref:Apoptosis-inducing factor 3 n=1 Tax=Perkinsus olseni TaxID=32597 RepID=A0A7J6MYH3_PEROL|nr:Apoptosis-inducing factor 3 [Perkinsus olseni]
MINVQATGQQAQQGASLVYAVPQQPQQVGIDVNGDGQPDIMVPVGTQVVVQQQQQQQTQPCVYQQQPASPMVAPQVQISNQAPYSQSRQAYPNPYAQSQPQQQQQPQVYGSQYAQQPPQQVQMSAHGSKKDGKKDDDDSSGCCACCACLLVVPCCAALGALLGSMFGGDIAEALGDAAGAIGDAIPTLGEADGSRSAMLLAFSLVKSIICRSRKGILYVSLRGQLYATGSKCTYKGCDLKDGLFVNDTVACPKHDAAYDITTGVPVRGPGLEGLCTYRVEERRDGKVYVDIPKNKGMWVQGETVAMAKRDPRNKQGRTYIIFTTLDPFVLLYGIEVLTSSTVVNVDTKGKNITIEGPQGLRSQLDYDKCLYAAGADPVVPDVLGSDADNVHFLRTAEDATRIADSLRVGHKVLIIGSGFIAMEMASALENKGLDIAIVGHDRRPLERILGRKVARFFSAGLEANKMKYYGNSEVRLFRYTKDLHGEASSGDTVNGCELTDGEVLPVDVVIVGIGADPNTEPLKGVELLPDGSVPTDQYLAVVMPDGSSNDSLYAAGDVASYPDVKTGDLTRVQHWDVAMQQGRVAAANMTGSSRPYITSPFFWTTLFGRSLQYVGNTGGREQSEHFDDVYIEGDVDKCNFVAFYCKGDSVVAAATVGRDPVASGVEEMMNRGKMPKTSELKLGICNAEDIMKRLHKLDKEKPKRLVRRIAESEEIADAPEDVDSSIEDARQHAVSFLAMSSPPPLHVLVTGGAGFIGSHVAEALLRRGCRVTNVDSLNEYYDVSIKKEALRRLEEVSQEVGAGYVFHRLDLADASAIEKALDQQQVDVICHLAAQAGVRYSIDHATEVVGANITATVNVFELARKQGVKKVVAASSSSVYGDSSTPPFKENSESADKPVSPYAATKRSCELFAETYAHLYGLDIIMLRFFTVYGPRGRPDMACFKFIDAIDSGRPITKFGDGSMIREFTFISDIVEGVLAAIELPRRKEKGVIKVNLGGGSCHTLNEFIDTIETELGRKAVIQQMPVQPGDVFMTSADQGLAKKVLNFNPRVSLHEGIHATVGWYRRWRTEQGGREVSKAAG